MNIKKFQTYCKRYYLIFAATTLFFMMFSGLPVWSQESASSEDEIQKSMEEENKSTDKETKEYVNQVEEIVVKSTKMDRKPEHMTDSVTIINEARIELENYTDTTEILRMTPSVEFKQAGGPGQFSYPKMRGYPQGHYLVLINGMKLNEAYNAGVGNFIGHIDTELVESVEILRGPQSALYGSDTSAGVMSFTTLGGKPGLLHTKQGFEYGSLEWKKGYSVIRGSTETWDYAFAGAYTNSEGVHDEEYYRNISPTAKIGWHTGSVDLELAYIYVNSEFQAAELNESNDFLESRSQHYAFQTPDPNNANKYEHHIGTLNVAHTINDTLRQKMVLGVFEKGHFRNDEDDGLLGYEAAPFDGFTFDDETYNKGDLVPIYDDGTGEAYGNDHKNIMVDYNFIWDRPVGKTSTNSALFGFEYLYQKGGKWGRYGDLESDNYNYSFYLNDQLLLLEEALVLSGGLRQDENEAFGSETTGKIGVAYTFSTTTSTLFSNYGTSFRAPTFFNLYDATYGNEDLTPETGWTFEGGVRQEFMDGRLDGDVTYWYSELDNVIVFDNTIPNPTSSTGFGKYGNRDSMETSGVEFAFGVNFTDELGLSGNYTYTDSKSTKDGEEFRTVQVARNKGSLTLSYENDKYNVGMTGYYSGPRLRWKGDIEMREYFRLDLFGHYNIYKNFSVYTRMENVLEEDIEEGLGYEQPGFYAIVGLKYEV